MTKCKEEQSKRKMQRRIVKEKSAKKNSQKGKMKCFQVKEEKEK